MSGPPGSAARAAAGWALVAALAAVAVGFGVADARQPAPAQPADDDVAQRRGAQLYSLQCARCHGADGRGAQYRDVDVPGLRTASPALVDLVLRTGRMPPGDLQGRTPGGVTYDDGDRQALVAYVTERFELDGELAEPGEGDAARGREVFATHCAACHGSTGAGGVAGAGALTPDVIGADPTTVAAAIREGPFRMPRFSADQISDAELGDVAAFLAEVAEEPKTPLGLAELNPVYASGFVLVLALALLASLLWIAGRATYFPDHDDPDAGGAASDASPPDAGGDGSVR